MPGTIAKLIGVAAVAAAEQAAAKAKANAPPAAMQLLPKVRPYGEATGLPETAQDSRPAAEHHPPEPAALPWQEWLRSAVGQALHYGAAAVAAISLVLSSLHCNGEIDNQNITVTMNMGSKQRATKALGK